MLRKQIEEKIEALLRNHGHKAFRPKEMAKRLGLTDNRDYRAFREILHEMAGRGDIAQIKGGRFTLRKPERQATGVMSINPRGYGIVTLDDDREEVFVRSFDMWTALHGDRVQVTLRKPATGDRRREAVVDRVLERRCTATVGTFEPYGGFGLVTSDDNRFLHEIRVATSDAAGAGPGDKVQVRIDRFDDPDTYPEGTVIRILGKASEPGVAEKALALSLDIPIDFPEETLDEANRIDLGISDAEIARREDFRANNVFTIDPEDARDFDDAIHVKRLDQGHVEVGIHIADVSHYVPTGSAVDREALHRGTSVYLVEHVFPMLPEHLSNEICTLRSGADRLTMSCLARLDARGNVSDYRITNSVIHSKARFTYEEAQQILDGSRPGHPLERDLQLADQITGVLRIKRFEEGSIDFDTPEAQVILDEHQHPVDIRKRDRLRAHSLIEELMLLANRLVAHYMSGDEEHASPFVYRVHEAPDRDRIASLAEYVGMFGMELQHDRGSVDPVSLNRLLQESKGTPRAPVITMAALRSMAKARYATANQGHFGLGFDRYTHFTSPIRRYPDLEVHRLTKRKLAGKAQAETEEHLKEICARSSERERVAEEAEREAIKLKQVQFLQEHIGEQHVGIVTGAMPFGVFVQIEKWLVEGLVHVREMENYYEYDERQYALVSSGGKKIRVGDTVDVIIVDANEETREIDFLFAPSQGL